ncbi:MAG: hypothetical protein R2791_22555 [Saprospiraceae bacterium]
MLLKWLFTFLAILWIYQALRPLLGPSPQKQPPPSPPPDNKAQTQARDKGRFDDEGEYIDYEEVE